MIEAFEKGALPVESIPELHERLARRSADIKTKLNSLELPGSATRRLSYGFERFDKLIAYVAKARESLGKIAFLVPLLGRLGKYVGL